MKESLDFNALVDLCRRTHEHMQLSAARAANTALAARNWLFGWYAVEYEQHGADRAEYGERLIDRLSGALGSAGITGTSPTNLRKFREFYRTYPQIRQTASGESLTHLVPTGSEIQQTPSVESLVALAASPDLPELVGSVAVHFRLGWSHYVELLTIDNSDERQFYEIEAAQNGWLFRS